MSPVAAATRTKLTNTTVAEVTARFAVDVRSSGRFAGYASSVARNFLASGSNDPAPSRRMYGLCRILLVVVVAVLFASSCVSARNPVWSDEFTGPASTPPDSTRWHHDTGGTGWGNNELEYYTDGTANAALDGNGHLVITALPNASGRDCWYGPCRYTSARLTTQQKFSRVYGRFEARIKLPVGQGIWPAFWLLGDNIDDVGYPESGEIDVMEYLGDQPHTIHGSLHGPGYDDVNDYVVPGARTLADDFHLFAIDWSKNAVDFSVDGIVYETLHRRDAGEGWVFDHPFFVLLNVAVGGDWPGSPDDSTPFPARMVVDYVRVYALPETSQPTAP